MSNTREKVEENKSISKQNTATTSTNIGGGSYNIQSGTVYFNDALTQAVVFNADPLTVRQLKDDAGRYIPYAIDAHSVFFGPNIVSGADPNSFRKVKYNSRYDRDLQNYFFSAMAYSEPLVDGADYKSFKVFEDGDGNDTIYAHDSEGIYCNGMKLTNGERSSFIVDKAGYSARDAHHVYDGCSLYDPNKP